MAKALLAHDALHVLHNHDGVVHEQADGKYHGEHGEHINGKPEERKDAEGPEEHDGHGDGGDQRGPQASHEKPHDEEDEQDGFKERLHHFPDAHLDEGGGVVGVDDLHPAGKRDSALAASS